MRRSDPLRGAGSALVPAGWLVLEKRTNQDVLTEATEDWTHPRRAKEGQRSTISAERDGDLSQESGPNRVRLTGAIFKVSIDNLV